MQLVPPPVPPDVLNLWTAGLALVTAAVTQLLKSFISPIHNAPDSVKALLALVVAIAATAIGRLVGAPLPPDLHGAVGVVVAWLAAMGAHRLALVLKVVPPSPL